MSGCGPRPRGMGVLLISVRPSLGLLRQVEPADREGYLGEVVV